jgi:D-ribose pyranase
MKEIGILNGEIAGPLSKMGHTDQMMVVDAGFSIPKGVQCIDLSLDRNIPDVPDVLKTLKKYFSIEKMILAEETKKHNPSRFNEIVDTFQNTEIEIVTTSHLREIAKSVKFIIRTGSFTAFSNVVLVSAGGKGWYLENE